jgi:hypothetical protein
LASDNEVEKLVVTLEADYRDFLKQIDRAVDEAVRKLKETEEAPKRQQTAWEQLGGYLKGQFLTILASIGTAVAAAFSVGAIVNFFRTIAGGMVETNKQFETFRVQFETLLGSQSEAQKRIDELAKFGVETPFELSEIVQADRLLQTFGGTALATGENLRRIGDSAAAVNAGFQEVSFWTGRMYSAMMGGQPFGEASMRLQELGIMSGDVRQKLEEMQKSGADGAELWAYYASVVDEKFGGAMDRLSKTLSGVMSNLADFQAMLLREGGEELFEGVREDAIEFYDIISDPKAQEALTKLAAAFGSVLDALREAATTPFLESLRETDPAQVESLAASLQDVSEAIEGISGLNVTSVSSLVDALDGMAQSAASILQVLDILKELSLTASGIRSLNQAGVEFGEVFGPLLNPVYGLAQATDNLNGEIKRLTGSSISEWLGNVEQPAMAAASSLDAMGFAADGVAENMRGAAQATEEAGEDFTKAREKFESLSQSFLDAQEEINEKRQELEEEHGERVADIQEAHGERVADLEEEIAERREEIVEETAERLADLEKEGAERREEIARDTAKALEKLERDTAAARADAIASANEQLAELEEDTQNSVSEVQEEAREEERRATEDHQREMRRLQQDYLMNLEDAVNARDARAIVDLRRKYTQEKREREEDFQTQRARAREDAEKRVEEARETEEKRRREIEEALEKQLKDIEENEAEKREEIAASQEEQLSELEENEAQKREEIAASQEEQLAKLAEFEAEKRAEIEESLAEQLAKEQENYTERQAALDEALQKRLEAVAKQLADEKEITEAGAEAILETLNEYYGVGGKMDQIMEGYRQRQQAQQQAATNFDANLPGGGPGGGDFVPAGSGGGAGLPAFAEGGIVPGPINRPRKVIAHGGELIVPYEEVSQYMEMMRGSMEANFTAGGTMTVEVKHSGSAPPGVQGPEIEAIAGTLVKALNEAGIRTKRR